MTSNTEPAQPVLLLLGPHGSTSSSLLASLFVRRGCGMPPSGAVTGAEGQPGDVPKPVADLNERILAASRSSWRDWRQAPLPEPGSPERAAFQDAAAALVAAALAGAAGPIMIEDPRLCRVLPVWLDALAREGCRPLLVIAHGSPFEAAQALRARHGLPFALGLLLWLRQIVDAERHSRGLTRAFMSHDRLRDEPGATAAALGERLGIPFSSDAVTVLPTDGILAAGLQGPVEAFLDGETDQALLDHARGCFEFLELWASEGENGRDHEAFDQANAALMAAGWTFIAMADDRRLADAEVQVRELGGERDRQARELGALTRLMCAVEEELDASVAEGRAASLRAKKASVQLEESLSASHALADQVRSLNDQLKVARKACQEAEEQYRSIARSTSWRLTAPLRRVVATLKGARSP